MNLIKLGYSSWIIFLNILLILVLIYVIFFKQHEYFINYPQQVNPISLVKSNPDATAANNNYASILIFLKNNPAKSVKFIEDIKHKFFDNNCSVRNDIDFNNIAKFPLGMPFS
jgi:hypothetical protein